MEAWRMVRRIANGVLYRRMNPSDGDVRTGGAAQRCRISPFRGAPTVPEPGDDPRGIASGTGADLSGVLCHSVRCPSSSPS